MQLPGRGLSALSAVSACLDIVGWALPKTQCSALATLPAAALFRLVLLAPGAAHGLLPK